MKNPLHYVKVLQRKFVKSILKNKSLAKWLSNHWLRLYLRLFYFHWVEKHLSYSHPQDLNQALIKMSLRNSKDKQMRALIPMCADKYAVRTYITAKGYGDTLNELYGVYDNVDDIDFNSLPDQFVMKMNNASGRNYICTDKSKCNWSLIKHQFADWLLDHDFAWETGEWQYALIQPRIIIEKYLSNLGQKSLVDYKFHCFNGQVLSCLTCYDREDEFVKLDDYNLEWSRTEDILPSWHAKDRQMLPKPISYDRMIQMAEICTKEFEYCRFDVYEIDGKILFGEMTFTPHGGVLDYYSDDFRIRNKNLIK